MKKISQSGRSMMEMLGVLAIVGVLSVGGFAMVGKMQANYEANKVMDEIADFSNRIRTVYRDFDSGGMEMNKYLRKAKAYPDSFNENESGTIDNSNFVGITGVEYGVTCKCNNNVGCAAPSCKNPHFLIALSNVTEDLCNQIVTSNWGSPSTNGFVGIESLSYPRSSCDNESCGRANSKNYPVPMGIGAAVTFCEKHHSYFNLIYK